MKKQSYLNTFLVFLISVFLIYIGNTLFKKIKYDLTDEKLYTLSDGTKEVLSKVSTPLRLKLYYSKTAALKGSEGIRVFNLYFEYVKDLLGEYVFASQNRISLEIIDPRPDTKDEEDAVAFGLKKFNLTDSESYIFGLVIRSDSGGEKIIEFFDPQRQESLEYELTQLIHSVLNPNRKVIGILSSLPIMVSDKNPYLTQLMKTQGMRASQSWLVVQLLTQFYGVKSIDPNSESISGIDALFIIHPKNFSEKLQLAIDQYLLQGGKILLLVAPNSIADRITSPKNPSQNMSEMVTLSSLPKLMKQWGIEMKEGVYAGDRYLAELGRMAPDGPLMRILPIVKCDQRCTAPYRDMISSGLQQISFLLPGVLTLTEEGKKSSELLITPLLSTTEKGNSYRAELYELNSPQTLWDRFVEGSEPVVMGYKIKGKFKTAFPESKGIISSSTKESAVIVYSDVDFIYDQFAFRQSGGGVGLANNNVHLLMNSLEALTGSTELLSLRTKGRIIRPFEVIDEIEIEADKKTATKVTEIKANIDQVTKELNQIGQKVGQQGLDQSEVVLLQSEGMQKKKELQKKIAQLKSDLRDVKREGREKVEWIGKNLLYMNTLFMPILLALIGFALYYRQKMKSQPSMEPLIKGGEHE